MYNCRGRNGVMEREIVLPTWEEVKAGRGGSD